MSDAWANVGGAQVPRNPDEWKAAFSGKNADMIARLILASLDSYRVKRLPMTVSDVASMINVLVALEDMAVRRGIEALREPTQDMIEAASDEAGYREFDTYAEKYTVIWQAMIDEILEPHEKSNRSGD